MPSGPLPTEITLAFIKPTHQERMLFVVAFNMSGSGGGGGRDGEGWVVGWKRSSLGG